MPGTIVIAGGSGELGSALRKRLAGLGHTVVILSRNPGGDESLWDAKTLGPWADLIEGAEAVINLAGRSIDCRFTPENRRQILESRVDSTHVSGQAITACKVPPRVWLQASAIGVYGEGGERELRESDVTFPAALPSPEPPVFRHSDEDPLTPAPYGHGPSPTRGEGALTHPLSRFAALADLPLQGGGGLTGSVTDFMAASCRLWEAACAGAETPDTRKVILRTAVVLSPDSGAFPKLWKLAKLGLGGAAGSGDQFFSWIHLEDWVRAVLFLFENSHAEGPFNLAAPEPVRNRDLMAALRKATRRPWSPPVPAPVLRIGSALMGTEADLILQSQRVVPSRLEEMGFEFGYPALDGAIQGLIATRT